MCIRKQQQAKFFPNICCINSKIILQFTCRNISLYLQQQTAHAGKNYTTLKVKVESTHAPQESVGGCSSPSSRPWTRKCRTTNVCDVWPVQHQTYGYLPSCKALLPISWYQIILLGDRGTCVLTACPRLHSTVGQLGFEPATCWVQV